MTLIAPRVIRGNRGDIASRYAILAELESAGVPVGAVFASRPEHVPSADRTHILPYGPIYNLWPGAAGLKAVRNADMVLWTGGLDLQDDSSLLKLVHMWLVFATYRLLGLDIILVMQGAGPIDTRAGRWLSRRVLALVRLALVRDKESFDLLSSLANPDKLRLSADGIFLSGFDEAPTPQSTSLIEKLTAGARGPVIGLNVRLWFHFANSIVPYQFARDAYRTRSETHMSILIDQLAHVVATLRKEHDARIVLLSMYEPGVEPWEDDIQFLERLKERFAGDEEVRLLVEDIPITAFSALLGRFNLMIGMRLHSALIALRMGTPAIHIAYTRKGHAIYSGLGLSDWLVPVEAVMKTPNLLIDMVRSILADPKSLARVQSVRDTAIAQNREALLGAVAAATGAQT